MKVLKTPLKTHMISSLRILTKGRMKQSNKQGKFNFLYFFLLTSITGFIACTSSDNPNAKEEKKPGQYLYAKNCSVCHGDDGKKKLGGAKDLSISMLTPQEQEAIINTGKGGMAGFKGILSEDEINQVVIFISGLKSKNKQE